MGILAKTLIDYKLMNFLCYQHATKDAFHIARGRSRTPATSKTIRFVLTNGFLVLWKVIYQHVQY